jgi:hypothetical protein
MIQILTIQDAAFFTNNSGVANWEWYGDASLDGFTDWIYQNCTWIDPEDYDDALSEYLESVGEAPADYGL